MPTNITAIQPRRYDIRTSTNADWLDTFIAWQAGIGGTLAGEHNCGSGEIAVSGIAPQTPVGIYTVTITGVHSLTRLSVRRPDGTTVGGVAGLPVVVSGLMLTLSQGDTALAVGDEFAISVVPVALDITGISFTLQARANPNAASIAFSASTFGDAPLMRAGTSGGEISMDVNKALLSEARLPPATRVYDVLATADGRTVQAFYGTWQHVDGVTYLP